MLRMKLLAAVFLAAAGSAAVILPGWGTPAVSPAHAAPVPKDEEAKKKPLEEAWADLASANEQTASRALLKLRDFAGDAFFADKLKPLKLTEERAKELLTDLGSDDEKTWKAAYEELSYLDPRLAMSVSEIAKESTKVDAHDQRIAALLCGQPAAAVEIFRWCKIAFRINPAPPKTGYAEPDAIVITNHPNKPADFKNILDLQGAPTGFSRSVGSNVNSLNSGSAQPASWRRAVRAVALLEHLGTPEAKKILQDLATGHEDAGPTKAAKAALERRKTWP